VATSERSGRRPRQHAGQPSRVAPPAGSASRCPRPAAGRRLPHSPHRLRQLPPRWGVAASARSIAAQLLRYDALDSTRQLSAPPLGASCGFRCRVWDQSRPTTLHPAVP
jgi:hypothetical protein